jgi:hypothetical protein
MNRQPNQHTAHLLYQALIMGKHNLPDAARRSGLSYDLLLKLCHGERHVHLDHVIAIYRGTQDLELLSDLVARDCDLLLSRRGEATGEHRVPTSIALAIGAAVGALQQVVSDAARDDVFDSVELAEILKSLETLERRAQALRFRLANLKDKVG